MGNYSLILLPTLKCNAACEYCFEDRTADVLSLDQLSVLVEKILDYTEARAIQHLTIYWQGGEVMTLPPDWYERAYEIIQRLTEGRGTTVEHSLQSNMIGYMPEWDSIIETMFMNGVGSSLDYPNLHRKIVGQPPKTYNDIWYRNVQQAREAGIEVQVIAIPNHQTLESGAERFYSYFVDELHIRSFQINTPFPGGTLNDVKRTMPLNMPRLIRFYRDLADIWMEQGYQQGIKIGPFEELLKYFRGQEACILCIWRENCVDEFICVDARGNVAQCDCWVTSYPDYWFGNIFEAKNLSDLFRHSKVYSHFQSRPEIIIQQEDCIACDYLAVCHGGCPIRTYSLRGTLFEKDPYCELYTSLFSHMEKIAVKLAQTSNSS